MANELELTDFDTLKKTFQQLGIPYRVFEQRGTSITPEGYTKPMVFDRIMAAGTTNYLFQENGKYVGMVTVEKIFEKRILPDCPSEFEKVSDPKK